MTVNALYGQADAESVVGLVASQNVEVLAVQELTPAFEDALAAAGLDDLLAHSFTVPADDSAAGSGLWSSTPLTEEEQLPGTSFAMPSALVDVSGTDVRVTVVHPHPPMPTDITAWRTELVELTEHVHADETPQIMAGDFNATYDHASFRELLGSRFSDATPGVGRRAGRHLAEGQPGARAVRAGPRGGGEGHAGLRRRLHAGPGHGPSGAPGHRRRRVAQPVARPIAQ